MMSLKRRDKNSFYFLFLWATAFLFFVSAINFGQDLTHVPCPYSFARVDCNSDVLHVLHGDGDLKFIDRFGGERLAKITTGLLNAVHFPSRNVGWVVGDKGYVAFTETQGSNWTQQKTESEEALNGINCSDERTCWVVGNRGTVLHTKDQGRTWEKMNPQTSCDLIAVHFVNAMVGWVVGRHGTILKTSTGGLTWEKQEIGMDEMASPTTKASDFGFIDAHFVDELRGWLTDADGIAETTDGGKSWEFTALDGWFAGAVSHDGKEVYVIAERGSNYRSIDGGKHWKPSK